MIKKRAFTTVLALAFAASAAACGKQDKPQPADEQPAAKTADPAGNPAAGDDKAAGDEAEGDKIADLEGLQPNAVPAQSLQALDGVAQFSLGDDKLGCHQYGKDMVGFFNNFQTEFKALEQSFTPDATGAQAMRKFAAFLKTSAGEMRGLKVEGDDLAAAHIEFVGTLDELAGGFEDLAAGIESQDEGKTQAAAQRVQTAVNGFKGSLNKLVAICGE